jgi:FKBP-type peptidyl-prolyl cis-trans isomerase 2
MPVGHQVGPDTVVTLDYVVFDAEGERVDQSDEPLEIVFGYGQLLPALEHQIEGLRAGDKRTIRLRRRKRSGGVTHRARRGRSQRVSADVAAGDRYEARRNRAT